MSINTISIIDTCKKQYGSTKTNNFSCNNYIFNGSANCYCEIFLVFSILVLFLWNQLQPNPNSRKDSPDSI